MFSALIIGPLSETTKGKQDSVTKTVIYVFKSLKDFYNLLYGAS